jgi:hypothetical protein
MITIVICYVRGTHEMTWATLNSIARYTQEPIQVVISAKTGDIDEKLVEATRTVDLWTRLVEVPERYLAQGREHGSLLDHVIQHEVESDLVLTLDSDAMPVRDGWLRDLKEMLLESNTVGTAGILQPWATPPANLKKTTMEYRVRSQNNWENTHVACQLIRREQALRHISNDIGYVAGDDTGLAIVKSLRAQGYRCVGYKPTRCAKPMAGFDAEFNRYTCVVFGDSIVHVGGFTRETVGGDDAVFESAFGWCPQRILEAGGAEFLLKDENSYKFQFDREEEVAAEKMQRLFGLHSQRMMV